MTIEKRTIDEHVGELLSGYIDGELTQQHQQRVDIHCDACPDCRRELDQLIELRKDVGGALLSRYGEDVWRENMNDTTTRVSRGIGWILFIAGVLAASGLATIAFLLESSISPLEKFIVVAVYGGLAALLVSVLRQRIIERKTDKYKDVEI
jgi:anti-sigma factor RsiW